MTMSRPRRSETVLTAEHLRRVLLYDPHTGLWKWREGGVTPEAASKAYEEAAAEHFGEYYRRLQ